MPEFKFNAKQRSIFRQFFVGSRRRLISAINDYLKKEARSAGAGVVSSSGWAGNARTSCRNGTIDFRLLLFRPYPSAILSPRIIRHCFGCNPPPSRYVHFIQRRHVCRLPAK